MAITRNKPPICNYCGHEITSGSDFHFYGVSGSDLLKMIRWLEGNNATIKDLDGSTLNFKFWNKVRIHDAMFEDTPRAGK